MKEGYFVLGGVILFQLGRVLNFYYQKWKLRKVETEITDDLWETYLKLRERIFTTTAAELNIELPESDETAFCLGYETHSGTEVRLIFVFTNAEIWAINTLNSKIQFFENDNDEVKTAVIAAMAPAQYHFARMRRKNTSVPEPGCIKFYILTNNDIYAAGASLKDMFSEDSPWQELYDSVNKVIEATQQQSDKE